MAAHQMTSFYMKRNTGLKRVNPFHTNVPFLSLYPLMLHRRSFDLFRGYRGGTLT